jgi:fatty-acyl-CoA synthase
VSDRWQGKTINAALQQAVASHGDAEAFIFPNGRLTFRELALRSDEAARAFLALGLQRGDRAAIWMAGYAEWAYAYFGLASIGAVMVPINTRYKPNELAYVLEKSGASALLFKEEIAGGKDYAAMLRDLDHGTLPALRQVIGVSSDHVAVSEAQGRPGIGQGSSFSARDGGRRSWQEFLAAGSAISDSFLAEAQTGVRPEDTAIIQFTSGTTAFPKGAELYQSGCLLGAAVNTAALELSSDDRFFSPQPFYHAGGSVMVMLCPVVTGCPVVVQAYFDATEALRLMERERCTSTMGHQPHWIEYLNHPDLPTLDLCLTKAFVFASPDVNRMVHDRLGIEKLLSPYGMTETHLGGTVCRLSDPLEARLTTVGRPHDSLEMQLRDVESGRVLRPGERGEVHFRGPLIMKGYYRDPERTAEVIDADGWFRTGDLGELDGDGNLHLIGRVKDMVRVGGENVAAAEVEGYLLGHPAIKQAVFVGRPDVRLGEVGVAFVELKAGAAAGEQDLLDFCRQGLASFKVPRAIRFVTEWPMSGTGKIQKFLLTQAALAG